MGLFAAVNQLQMELQQSIRALSERGWSQRRIARELGINRETVARYRGLARAQEPARLDAAPPGEALAPEAKPAIPPPGSPGEPSGANPAILPPGSTAEALAVTVAAPSPKPAIPPAGFRAGRISQCELYRAEIEAAVQRGLSAQRIYQDLREARAFAGSYDAVKRFVRALGQVQPLPFRRMESAPGQEAQVDFGQGAWVVEAGRRRRPHVLRLVLSASRKGYTEAFWQQTTENFIRGVENAFRHWGGVTATLVIDNLRAAVTKADWFEPELNPKVREFCVHYGVVVLPTKPGMPRHKGKVEAGVKYVQSNALAGRQFASLGEQNRWLAQWEASVADTRIHGTTRQQVHRYFETTERPQLRPLPAGLFPCFQEAPRRVHRDGYVEVAKAYYSVPPEYVRRQVWARWDAKLVRVFNERMEVIAVHARQEPGRFGTDPAHLHAHKRTLIERGAEWILDRCRLLGRSASAWAQGLYQQRGAECLRVLQGLLALAEKHPATQVDRACQLALTHGAWRLRDLRELLARPTEQTRFAFLEAHPLIRDLKHYENLVPGCFTPSPLTPDADTPSDEQR
ncbi:MAG TPA: IS21 family transposase [Lamprocystis sp. (in: g-proteobacteria)]|nr:IS21 family transposase [Lamprocystis sp. (in: g-proteobacteria)]